MIFCYVIIPMWSSPPSSLCTPSSSTVFYEATSFQQDPYCGPAWVDSAATMIRMFNGVVNGAIASEACCREGTYWLQGSSICTRCTTGKYNNEASSSAESACKDCASGKYNNELGLSACKDCASGCLLYTSPSPRDISGSRMPSSA